MIPDDPEIPEVAERFWACPRCPYRIALDFPGGITEPLAAHESAHMLADRGLAPRINWDAARLSQGTPRR